MAKRTGPRFRQAAPRVGRRAGGFTLIEVMIVIGIIAILVAMLFPVVIGATDKARQKQAQGEAFAVLMGIKAYQQEYGKLPGQYDEADTNFFTNNWVIVQTLWGSNLVWPPGSGRRQNPKEKVFLNMQYNTNSMDPDGNLLDPWGIPYVIALDQDGTNGLPIRFVGAYRSVDDTGRRIGATNIALTNISISNVIVGVGSLGRTSNTVPLNTWDEVK